MSTYDRTLAQGLNGQSIKAVFETVRAKYDALLNEAKSRLKALCGEAESLRAGLKDTQDSGMAAVLDVEGLLSTTAILLNSKQSELKRAEQDLWAFRVRRGLTQEPDLSQSIINTLLFLGCLTCLESILNSLFFGNAHLAASPASALLTSTLISITNVFVSLLAGYAGRWLDYGANADDSDAAAFKLKRFRAKLLFLGYLSIIGFFHLTIGLIRSQESLHEVSHSVDAYLHLLTVPEAILLIIVGGCMSAFAYLKGLTAFDDPYPGYGKRARLVQRLRDELLDSFDEVSEEINNEADAVNAVLTQTKNTQDAVIKEYNDKVRACHDAHSKLQQDVNTAKSKLREYIAQQSDRYAAGGNGAPLTDTEIQNLTCFDDYLTKDYTLSDYLPPPDQPDHRAALMKSKAAALKRLHEMFAPFIQSKTGDKDDEKT